MKSVADLLKAVIMEPTEVVVGKVDASLIAKWEKNDADHEKAHDATKTEIEAFIAQKAKEHKPMCRIYKRREMEIMQEILVAAGIPESEHEKEYSVNKLTGEICRIDMVIDPRLKEAFEKDEKSFMQ